MKLIKVKHIVFIFLAIASANLSAQTRHELLRNGDESYYQGDFTTAEESYRKAIEKDGKAQAKYNLGNSLMEQERYEEALEQYQAAINSAPTDATKSKAYHNLGNALVNNQKYKESLEAYKQALRYNPEDLETKHNFSYAKQMMKQMQQQQQQQQNQEQQESEENDEQQEPQEQEQQENQEQQEEQENQQSQEGDQQQEIDNENEQQEPSEDKQDLDKEDARKLLEIAENEEKKVQEKMRKVSGGKKRKKDW